MAYTDEIINSFKELNRLTTEQENKGEILIGRVKFISSDGLTCSVQPLDSNRTIIPNIFLTSDLNLPLLTPQLESLVTVILFNETSGCIIQQGGVQKAEIAGNDYGGIIITAKLVEKLNNVENLLNSFFALYNAHIHPTPSGPSSPTTSLELNTLTPTVVSDVENTIVQHGKGVTQNASYTQQVVTAAEELRTAEDNLYDAKDNPNSSLEQINNLQNVVNQKQEAYNKLISNPEN